MEYFKKVREASRKAAIQGLQLIQTVTTAVSEVGLAPVRKPQDEFLFRFRVSCQLIDHYAGMEDADSTEADRALHDSKVRDHLKEMIRLLHEEDESWAKKLLDNNQGEDTSELPCLEAFLQYHIMQELCNRALKDKPRGCMTIILSTATSILKHVRYPLLPHQTVHVPLVQLISFATRYESLCGDKPGVTLYKKRIDFYLTLLISIMWKKMSDNPALLNFFHFIDNRTLTQLEAPKSSELLSKDTTTTTTTTSTIITKTAPPPLRIRSQFDILTALIPMMGKAKVGPYAKEAMLTALAMKDDRVENFILYETSLLHNIVTELSRKFSSAVDSFTSGSFNNNATASPGTPANRSHPGSAGNRAGNTTTHYSTPPSNHSYQNNHQVSSPSAKITSPPPLESYLKVLKFCNAISLVVSHNNNSSSTSTLHDSGTPLRQQLLVIVETVFLTGCLRPFLSSNGEGQVLAAQGLLRRTIAEIGSGGALLELIAKFFCKDIELMTAFVARAGSVSRAVSVSTVQLIGSLLGAAPLEDAMALVLGDMLPTAAESVKQSASALFSSALELTSEAAGSHESDVESTDTVTTITITEPSSQVDHLSHPPTTNTTITTNEVATVPLLDLKLSQLCHALNKHNASLRPDSGNNMVNPTERYVDAASHAILARLSGRLATIIALVRDKDEMLESSSGSGNSSSTLATVEHEIVDQPTESTNRHRKRGLIMDLVLRKLNMFLALKLDEQLAVTGLVEKGVCLLCAAIVATPGSHRTDIDRLDCVIAVLKSAETLWKEVSGHLSRVPDSAQKMSAVKHLLVQLAGGGAGAGKTEDPRENQRRMKLLEKDGAQVRRVLETAVVVQELLAEVRGALHAVRTLRQGLGEMAGANMLDGSSTSSLGVTDEEYDSDLEGCEEGLYKNDVLEETFLLECDDVQKGLELLCADNIQLHGDVDTIIDSPVITPHDSSGFLDLDQDSSDVNF